eukprot:gene8455-17431_t
MNEIKTPLREVRLRVAACTGMISPKYLFVNLIFINLVLLMLATDALNPVKMLCNALKLNSIWVTWMSIAILAYVLFANASELVYFTVKVGGLSFPSHPSYS